MKHNLSVPTARVTSLSANEISSTSAVLTFTWQKRWLQQAGMMDAVKGELKGFKV